MKLYQKTKRGGMKFLELKTDGPKFITTWGQVGGKVQTSTKVCKGMNLGRANETTPEKQAKLEMKAKITVKMKEGYTSTKPSEKSTIVQAKINLDKLPSNLCPNKPINQKACPKSVLEGQTTYGQKKHNGHCLILVKGKKSDHIYTRRMEDISPYVSEIPPIKEMMSRIPEGSMVLAEMTYFENVLSKQVPRHVASVIRKEDAAEALAKYTELEARGMFKLYPFDCLFWNNKFVGNTDYTDRYMLLASKRDPNFFDIPELLPHWKEILETAQKDNWEGFILRVPGEKSHVSYTMDGTAHRAGSWKYKFVQEGDFAVDEVLMGKSGKHANFYAKFHVVQFDENGAKVDRGYVGCGTLSHDELALLTMEINNKTRKLPFAVEIEYQSIHDDSGKLEFGQIQRIRDDKTAEECLAE